MVALVCDWHQHHDATRDCLKRRRQAGETAVIAVHSLV